ncbi:flavin-containing monooxygenase [Rhizobium tubonense]|uniref:Dimethylaniline monooxygenase n=1 Tax=Rhizobium tubonense TaxID=484088 RepID=A0A2W4CHD4_9HYPH|nr:NAD(P)/FAD-dependent oxidoreductase [Rhizobium tubonense]PZM10045.1 dimethylaniline monooxygenase [Rhizobium tubonense]
MIDEREVLSAVVIGAGTAGLIAAYELQRRGIKFRVLEKEPRVGEQWRRRHPQLTLNTHRDLSTLPGMKYRPGTSAFPKRDAVVSHLRDFVDVHAIPIDFGVTVSTVQRKNGIFEVHTDAGMMIAHNVIIAAGRDSRPWIPDWHGLRNYRGSVIHSAHFGNVEDYAGKNVLVVGAGNSGVDVLNHLARSNAATLWLSVRNGPTLLPKRLFGVTIHRLSPLTSKLPTKLADYVLALVGRLAFGDLTHFGLPKPKKGGISRLKEQVALALDDGAVSAIKKGRVVVVPEVKEFRDDRIVFADRRTLRPDIVIAATGYATGLEEMVGPLGVLDRNGRACFNGGEQTTDAPGLWFIGMRASILGDVGSAKKQAYAIATAIAKDHRRHSCPASTKHL